MCYLGASVYLDLPYHRTERLTISLQYRFPQRQAEFITLSTQLQISPCPTCPHWSSLCKASGTVSSTLPPHTQLSNQYSISHYYAGNGLPLLYLGLILGTTDTLAAYRDYAFEQITAGCRNLNKRELLEDIPSKVDR